MGGFAYGQECGPISKPKLRDPAKIPEANITISTPTGGTVTSIQANTDYQICVANVAGNSSFFTRMIIGLSDINGRGLGEYGMDIGTNQTACFTVTTDAVGGLIVMDIRGTAGGGFYQLCKTTGTDTTRKLFN